VYLCGIQSAQVAAELQELGALLARFDVPEQVVTGQIAGGEQVAGPVVAVAGGATTGARLTLRVLVPATALGPVPTGVLQVENGRPCSTGFDFAIFLISRRSGRVKVRGRPPAYFGYSEPNPSALKLRMTSRARSSLVNVTPAIFATGIICAESSTV
jgi:hypothetical protein